MIKFYNVTVSFFGEKKALDTVNLKVRKGEFLYVTGESGAGKSTMLRLIYADLMPTRGIVMMEGKNLGTLTKPDIPFLRRNIGVVFQDFKLLEDKTVYDNIKLALEIFYMDEKSIKEKIFALLKHLGIFQKRDTQVRKLSGGEKQRVAIARALINSPKLILADEPTGNLDVDNADKIMSLLSAFARSGATVIVATHDPRLMGKFPARVIALKDGKVKSDSAKKNTEKDEDDEVKGGSNE